ncbi:MAG: epoxyqueuosine reductase [Methanosphaera stadtmanae]|jgi:epoxyqueuosine reductase QueG|nr:epoxyqueuosine reductase [Methanosphaera stadtmanae]
MSLIDYIEELSDVYGIADFSLNQDELIETYGEDICKYPYAIAIGHRMLEDIIEKIPLTYNDDELAQEYLDEYYHSHQRVSKIAKKIIKYIENENYQAIELDVSGTNPSLNLKMPFSNKASAHLAGIGWLGKNNLLTTEKYGPRITWATILTNAPLAEYTGRPMESLCGDCDMCVKACPGKAITDLPDPAKSYDPNKCGEFLMSRKEEGRPIACGMCLYICPYGNEKTRKILNSKKVI